jgi:dTDP-glucose 4,6-dehydratase
MTHALTYLVTGGAGFIGSALVRVLAADGARILVLDALTYAGHPQNLTGIEGDVTLIKGSINDAALLVEIFAQHQPDGIFHLAAESHVDNSIGGPRAFIDTNITGSFTLLEAARTYYSQLTEAKRTLFRYVHVSTDEVYGALGEEGVFRAADPLAPTSPYSASKAASDLLAFAWHHTYGLPIIVTRCSNNYGPRQHPEKLIPRMVTRALKGESLTIYGSGKQVRDWIHVEDHARGLLAALKRGIPGTAYLFGGHCEKRNVEVIHAICDLLTTLRPGRDYTALITHTDGRPTDDFRYAIDDSDTLKSLGWNRQVTDFSHGLRATVEWYLANSEWIATMENNR